MTKLTLTYIKSTDVDVTITVSCSDSSGSVLVLHNDVDLSLHINNVYTLIPIIREIVRIRIIVLPVNN